MKKESRMTVAKRQGREKPAAGAGGEGGLGGGEKVQGPE